MLVPHIHQVTCFKCTRRLKKAGHSFMCEHCSWTRTFIDLKKEAALLNFGTLLINQYVEKNALKGVIEIKFRGTQEIYKIAINELIDPVRSAGIFGPMFTIIKNISSETPDDISLYLYDGGKVKVLRLHDNSNSNDNFLFMRYGVNLLIDGFSFGDTDIRLS